MKYTNDPFWQGINEAEHQASESYNDQYARVAGDKPVAEPILARFPQRLNGALMAIKQMPKWMWPQAIYDRVWPVLMWEADTRSEEDSAGLMELFGESDDAEQAVVYLCDYMQHKLEETR